MSVVTEREATLISGQIMLARSLARLLPYLIACLRVRLLACFSSNLPHKTQRRKRWSEQNRNWIRTEASQAEGLYFTAAMTL
jgi:hypothetical protein